MNILLEAILNKFGLELKHSNPKTLESVDIEKVEGAIEGPPNQSGIFSYITDYYSVPKNDVEQIKTCRNLSVIAEIERALNEIYNEIFIFDATEKRAVDIDFYFATDTEDSKKISESLIDKIRQEYIALYNILDFQKRGTKLFSHWYVDGKLFLQKIVDKNNPKNGIQRVIRIDPIKIKKVVEYPKPSAEGIYDLSKVKIYYVFSDTNDAHKDGSTVSKSIIINNDAITYSDSGIYDNETGMVLSHLWKAIVPYNNMKLMQDALIVYRVVRSPERRIFYIATGNLPKLKAEQYIKDLMNRFRNKLVYDLKTGTIANRKNVLSMVEDYWLPRRDDGKGTEISTLPGASNLGEISDIELFRKIFLDSLNVPASRFREGDSAVMFSFGRSATDINREEYRFKKFLDRLRNNFIVIFEDLLKTQLILKNIVTEQDWDEIKNCIIWVYAEDNNFIEWKESEIINSRISTLQQADPFVGKYFSRQWALKNIFKMNENEIEETLRAAKDDLEDIPDVFTKANNANPEAGNQEPDNKQDSNPAMI